MPREKYDIVEGDHCDLRTTSASQVSDAIAMTSNRDFLGNSIHIYAYGLGWIGLETHTILFFEFNLSCQKWWKIVQTKVLRSV